MKGDKGFTLSPFSFPGRIHSRPGYPETRCRSPSSRSDIPTGRSTPSWPSEGHGSRVPGDVRTIRARAQPAVQRRDAPEISVMAGIVYTRLPFGGLRKRARIRAISPGATTRSVATPTTWRRRIREGIAELLALARDRRTAILCAEALYYRLPPVAHLDALCAAASRRST